MKRDGIENFSFEILEECPKDLLDERERFYIAQYNSSLKAYGYNLTTGGKGYAGTHSEEHNRKIAEAKKGRKIAPPTKETLAKSSAALKGLPKSDEWKRKMSEIMKGREITLETRGKISQSLKGRFLPPEVKEKLRIASTGRIQTEETRQKISQKVSKAVCQLDSEGRVLAVFKNARTASVTTGVDFTSISSCCHGKRNKAGGFRWKFQDENE